MLNRAGIYGDQGFWIRKVYREGFLHQSITAVIRPGDRSNPDNYTHISAEVEIPVRFINSPGVAMVGMPGNLLPDDGTTVMRTECLVKTIGTLTTEDLQGCAPDYATPELARYHLANTYNTELPSAEDILTIWRFKYLPNVLE